MFSRKVFLLFFIITNVYFSNAQIDSSHFLNFYYGMGVSNPVGSYSKYSAAHNNFGKLGAGLSMKAGMEYFVDAKNAVSIDLEYGFFFNSKNDSLSSAVKRRVDSYATPYIKAGDDEIDVYIATVSLGYSRLFNFKKFSLQAKFCAGRANFVYDYTSAYLFTNALSISTAPTASITANSVVYEFNDYHYFTLKPELILKRVLKRNKSTDLVLGISASYFYVRPNMKLYETKDAKVSEMLTLTDNINVVNVNVSLNLILKRSILKVFK